MRRSAAPSKLNKRPFFSPPFKVPEVKKLCTEVDVKVHANDETVMTLNSSPNVSRSTKDILTLIKRPLCDSTQTLDHESDSLSKTLQSNVENDISETRGNLFNERYYSVVWCKLSKKKHKKWEGDGILIVKERTVVLKDMEGKEIGRSTGYKIRDLETLEDGNTLTVGGKEIEIQGVISKKDFDGGLCFQGLSSQNTVTKAPTVVPKAKTPFRLPSRIDGHQLNKENEFSSKPLFDPTHPDSIVLPRPPASHQWKNNTKNLPVVDVIVDPFIGKHLRPHQQAGIIFLFECVMAYKMESQQGAILADEMGLGKTLQCISLIWTLLKQGPYGGLPIFKKVLIVTPSSLTINWGKEFNKWLGSQRIKVFIVDQNNKPETFVRQSLCPIMIISYEMLVRTIDKVKDMPFDLLLCDEGHRLKNSSIKTTSLIAGMNIKRRIILTGTPVQNDLQEFYSLIEFVNPGVLGTSNLFKRVYEDPILKSKQPMASTEEKHIGESRAAELNRIISLFTLRRTQEIINKYLPPKTEFVIFCRPMPSQAEIYDAIADCNLLRREIIGGNAGDHLSAITLFRKLCNHPSLLQTKEGIEESCISLQNEAAKIVAKTEISGVYSEEDSGKLAVVSCILWYLSEEGRERVVLVSNFTSTLDLLQSLCEKYKYPFFRLDGSTPVNKRQSMVDKFNDKHCQEFVFLLSAKAGGVGLNLIGSSRIILFDIDWNPATDLQAMARVWRDGQKKQVYIYRLLLAGSIEEKIYQRQVCKQGISGTVVDARQDSKIQFSVDELADLFSFKSDALSLTHDLLECNCDRVGGIDSNSQNKNLQRECQLLGGCQLKSTSKITMDQLYSWHHYEASLTSEFGDPTLESAKDFITFVFKCRINQEDILKCY